MPTISKDLSATSTMLSSAPTRNRHLGENGSIIIAGEDWNIVSDRHGNEEKNLDVSGIFIDRNTMPEGIPFEATVYGEDSICAYIISEGYYIVASIPRAEAMFSRDIAVYVTVFMEFVVFGMLFIVVYVLIKMLVVDNIAKINRSLAKITSGNLDTVIDVRTNEEFASLSDDINSTVLTLKRYIARPPLESTESLNLQSRSSIRQFPPSFRPIRVTANLIFSPRWTRPKRLAETFMISTLSEKTSSVFSLPTFPAKGSRRLCL